MPRKGYVCLLLISILALLTYSCATLKDLIQEPRVSFENMQVKDLSLFEGTMLFNLKVDNPNPIGLLLENVNYDLKLDNKDFIEGVLDKGINLKANGSEPFQIPVTVNFMKMFQNVAEFIKKDEVPYDLSGSFRVHIFAIPFRVKGKLPIPKIPEISLQNVDVKNLSLTGAKLVFNLKLKNPNDFTVALNGLKYGLSLGDKQVLSGETMEYKSIDKQGQSIMSIPLQLNILELGQTLYKNISQKKATSYSLQGSMNFDVPKIGTKSFPFSQKGQVSFH
ncbi:LEA type 2 family protein [bacterium]|nr:LEA type 2 family protein [bacterium]